MASRLQDVILRGLAADRPAAADVAPGTLYYSTDTSTTDQSDGSSWATYADAGSGIDQLTGDVTAGPGSGSQAATLANTAVTPATYGDATHVSQITVDSKGRITAASDVAISASGGITTLTGDVTAGPGSGSQAATIANDAVTYAKMQDVSATSRILGRKTSGAGNVEECTLSEVLDFIGSAAQGDILYRGASGWARLGAGTSGFFLKTQGPAADPIWATGGGSGGGLWTLITSGSPTGVNHVDVASLSAYTDIRVFLRLLATSGGASSPLLRVSTDNGSTFLSSSGDYIGINGNGTEVNKDSLEFGNVTSTAGISGEVLIEGFNLAAPKVTRSNFFSADAINLRCIPTTSVLNAIRIVSSSAGNFTSGSYFVFGRS